MRHWLITCGAVVLAFSLLACGGGDDDDGPSGGSGGGGGGGAEGTVQATDSDELSYLTLTLLGVSRIEAESGDETVILTWEDVGVPFGETMTGARIHDGLLWGSVGPGHLIAIDPDSGDIETDLQFASTQPVTDFGFANGLVWVEAGIEYYDAVILAVDPSSGDVMFVVEPPAGTTIGGMAAGDEGIWIIGGDPEKVSAISRIDPVTGRVDGTFDTGLNVKHVEVAFGSVWAGGGEFAFEGGDGAAIARIDPATGAVIETIETGEELAAVLAYSGALWVADSMGADSTGAELLKIDPATNAIVNTIGVGELGRGGFYLQGGSGYVWATNPSDRSTYLVNAETAEGESVLTGPTGPIATP
jgi:hypothetical protein